MTIKKSGDSAVAVRRKEQVLAAAAECVRMDGFHRTSMSQISAAAGMSSGHIHHFFGGKEGIIEGVVAREHSELGDFLEEVRNAAGHSDAISAFTELVPKCAERYMAPGHAALAIEILAEASRNQKVASLIYKNDDSVSESFHELFGGPTPEVQSRCEIIAALFEGLSARAIRNPESAERIDMKMLQRVIYRILKEE
ncbi:TetR/AcrR family transcriptional regulator [Pseudomonas sp. xss_2]|uniref:TetR/AcrR family transcriptional regulator n=1 Tax=Pseudomonas sp. xss_2 TaxID=3367215 RepID=UPI00370A58EF